MIKNEISELRKLSDEIIKVNTCFAHQARDLKKVCNTIRELIMIVNPDCTVKYINKPMLSKLGMSEDDVLGKMYTDVIDIEGLCGVSTGAYYIEKLNGRYLFECSDMYDGDNFVGFICNFRELESCEGVYSKQAFM